MSWKNICNLKDIPLNSGVGALVGEKQIALFKVASDKGEQVFALSNYDPFSEANVLARGLIGTSDEQWVIISPIYKQRFRLTDGQCIEDESVKIDSWLVKIENGEVLLREEALAAA